MTAVNMLIHDSPLEVSFITTGPVDKSHSYNGRRQPHYIVQGYTVLCI